VNGDIAPESKLKREALEELELPEQFGIYNSCVNGHWMDALCRSVDGVWSETDARHVPSHDLPGRMPRLTDLSE
jgi:hypothetical protein